jgi:hypothetical protein
MKTNKITLLSWVGVLLFSVTAIAQAPRVQATQKKAETVAADALKPATEVKWEEASHNFGDIKKGVPVNNDFTFVNTTSETIIITNVKASCGCTATNYTKTPIKPGETGFVSAKYNAASTGPFSKTVRVNFNENEKPVTLIIKGKVVEGESR